MNSLLRHDRIHQDQSDCVSDNCSANGSGEPAALETEVVACLPIIPVLADQLAESMQQVQDAVVQIGDSFQRIANRSRESVTQAASCLGTTQTQTGTGQVGGQVLVEMTRTTMQKMLDRIEQARLLSLKTVDGIEIVERTLLSAEKLLSKVDAIATAVKILSLNARIEAARAGEAGKSFNVVATETGKVAMQAGEMSQAIRDVIQQVKRDVLQMTTELRVRADADARVAETSRFETNEALDLLTATHEQMRHSVELSIQSSEEVAKDVARAVMGLQFQDAVSQRVSHVITALHQLSDSLGDCVKGSPDSKPQEASTAVWNERLQRLYTMAQERRVLGGLHDEKHEAAVAGSNIEMF